LTVKVRKIAGLEARGGRTEERLRKGIDERR
jgi:hypothetical protein